jgi:hypothetical protein
MAGWVVDTNQKHYYYDASGDGTVDTIVGLTGPGGSLVSEQIGPGGENIEHYKAKHIDADWTGDVKRSLEQARGTTFTSSEDFGVMSKEEAAQQKTGAFAEYEELGESSYVAEDTEATGAYGAQNITREDFFDTTGKQHPYNYVVDMLMDKLKIKEDFLPRLEDIDTEKLGFLREEFGGIDDPSTPEDESKDFSFAESIAGEKAGLKKETDIYGLQQGAAKLGQIGGVGTGMASSARAKISGQETLKKGFETATDVYGVAKRGAKLAAEEGVYALQKERFDEQEFKTFVDSLSDV